jgi:hypothetical protein
MQTFLGRAIRYAGAKPKYLVCDQDTVFIADDFRRWLYRKRIKPRYGAVGQHGSIAVIERFIRTLKDEGTRRIPVPTERDAFRREIRYFTDWYNGVRPHSALDGRTPNEVYSNHPPANQQPRIEPRRHWHRRSPCAKPHALIAGEPGDRFTLEVTYPTKRPHLPTVSLKRAA